MDQRSESAVWRNEWVVKRFLEGVRGGVPFASEQLEVMLRVIRAGSRPIDRFLDLGSGSGLLAIALLTQFPAARATLVDYSEPMMEAARDLLGEDMTLPRFVLADFGGAHWTKSVERDAPFDAVVSGFAIHALEDARKQQLFKEIYDLLAPGGFFINVDHVAAGSSWLSKVFENAVIDSMADYESQVGTGRTRDRIAQEYALRGDVPARPPSSVDLQLGWLRDTGFADVDCYFKYFELAVFGGRRGADT